MAKALIYAFPAPSGTAVEEIVLVPSGKGSYEISVDEQLVYSKLATGKHISDGDVVELVRKAKYSA